MSQGPAVQSCLDLAHVLTRSADVARELVDVDVVALWVTAHDDELTLAAHAGVMRPAGADVVDAGASIAASVATVPALASDDVAHDLRVTDRRWLHAEGIRSLLALPIVAHGRRRGVIACGTRSPRSWGACEMRRATIVATVAAIAIESTGWTRP